MRRLLRQLMGISEKKQTEPKVFDRLQRACIVEEITSERKPQNTPLPNAAIAERIRERLNQR